MHLFRRHLKGQELPREVEIQAIRKETHKSISNAAENMDKLNKLLDTNLGTTGLIFLATGGDRRIKGKKK